MLPPSPGVSEPEDTSSSGPSPLCLALYRSETWLMTSTDLEARSLEMRAQAFAALSDPIRLRILDHLSFGSSCVCDLQKKVEVAPNLLSYHLRVLREAGLVETSRRGRWIDYDLAPGVIDGLADTLPGPVSEVGT
jgi:ArsR family transcriptional regulator, arsenate/arsenite/antimonite-responsive transcriptional repressor